VENGVGGGRSGSVGGGAGEDDVPGRAFGAGDEETALRVEERTFWLLTAIVERLLPVETYGASLEGAQVAQEVLWTWLLGEKGGKFGVAKVARWVNALDDSGGDRGRRGMGATRRNKSRGRVGSGMPPLSMVTTSWFMTLFVNDLPVETVLRVWDNFFFQGEKVLMRVTLTLIKIHEDQVLACSDPTEAWMCVKSIPPRMIDCHRLMEICFKPRVNLNPFELENGAGGATSAGASGPSSSRPSLNIGRDESDEDGNEGYISSTPNEAGGGRGEPSIRKLARYHKRGVGSVSSKLIAHYRQLALNDRKERTLAKG
ncbi:hypothetical protein HK101_003239, partial [Irineochytrium annulatum]